MNFDRLKSFYPTVFFGAETVAMVQALRALSVQSSPGWWAVLATSGAFLGYFGVIIAMRLPRTSPNLPTQLAVGALAAVVAGGDAARGGSMEAAAWGIGLGVFALPLYVFWYSRLPSAEGSPLKIGGALPSLPFDTLEGEPAKSDDHLGAPTVWLFFRGNWCPLCMAQIREVAASYREIQERGGRVALISPQPQKETRSLAKRHGVTFDYYVDRNHRAAKRLGILHEGGLPTGLQAMGYDSDTVLPTVIVTDAEGIVRFIDQTDNYRVRPEPSTFLAALRLPEKPEQSVEDGVGQQDASA
jgi:peroxiredoxin